MADAALHDVLDAGDTASAGFDLEVLKTDQLRFHLGDLIGSQQRLAQKISPLPIFLPQLNPSIFTVLPSLAPNASSSTLS